MKASTARVGQAATMSPCRAAGYRRVRRLCQSDQRITLDHCVFDLFLGYEMRLVNDFDCVLARRTTGRVGGVGGGCRGGREHLGRVRLGDSGHSITHRTVAPSSELFTQYKVPQRRLSLSS